MLCLHDNIRYFCICQSNTSQETPRGWVSFSAFNWRSRSRLKISQHTEWKKVNSSSLDNMAAISQTFSNALPWKKSFVLWFELHWSFFVRVQLTLNKHWFRWWLGAEQATSHYLNQCWPSSLMNKCGTRGDELTHLAPVRCGSNFQECFQTIYIIIAWALTVNFLTGKYHRMSLMKNQHWFRHWLGATRQQAITCTNVDPDLCHHMASVGNDLTQEFLCTCRTSS